MRLTARRAVAVMAALGAAITAGLPLSTANALPPGSPAESSPTVNLSPSTGNQGTSLNLTFSGAAFCQGDTSTGGYFWQSFLVSNAVDAGTLTFDGGGPVAISGQYVSPLYQANDEDPVVNRGTAAATASGGQLTGFPVGNNYKIIPNTGGIPNGVYKLGFACALAGQTTRFWQIPITISNSTGAAGGFTWSFGAVPPAPVLASPLTVNDGELSGAFTVPTATPANTALAALVTPTGGGTTITQNLSLGATTFTVTGLSNGTPYDVQIRATNSVGSTLSNVVAGTPAPPQRPGVTNLNAVGGPRKVDLSWTAPAAQVPALTGYSITAAPAGGSGTPSCSTPGTPVAGSPFSTAATSFAVTNLTAGTLYCFAVTPVYPAPYTAATASTQAAALGDGVIQQTITVSRPAGALKLTQRCAVTDGFPATTLDTATGFPAFPAIPQTSASPILTGGTAPTVVEAAPGNTTAVGAPDNQFGDYPDPAVQTKTNCNLNLGTAKLILSGSYKGQFFAASGAISQVSVLDTRDTDQGWTINGTMGQFNNGSFNFSGAYLGWQPKVSSTTSTPVYTQVVNAGAVVAPDAAGAAGLATARPLAVSPTPTATTGGLGLATLDARVNLLIPVTKPSGTYTGVLTISAL